MLTETHRRLLMGALLALASAAPLAAQDPLAFEDDLARVDSGSEAPVRRALDEGLAAYRALFLLAASEGVASVPASYIPPYSLRHTVDASAFLFREEDRWRAAQPHAATLERALEEVGRAFQDPARLADPARRAALVTRWRALDLAARAHHVLAFGRERRRLALPAPAPEPGPPEGRATAGWPDLDAELETALHAYVAADRVLAAAYLDREQGLETFEARSKPAAADLFEALVDLAALRNAARVADPSESPPDSTRQLVERALVSAGTWTYKVLRVDERFRRRREFWIYPRPSEDTPSRVRDTLERAALLGEAAVRGLDAILRDARNGDRTGRWPRGPNLPHALLPSGRLVGTGLPRSGLELALPAPP